MGFMPTIEDLQNPRSYLASEIISSDEMLLGTYYRENRIAVSYDEISENLIHALIATEDARFYKHSGIDGLSLFRVLFKTVILRQDAGGGSTITQQLAKNLFPRDTTKNRSFLSRKTYLAFTKFREWVTAVKLERNFTKEEIIALYLNTVTFGSETFGIKSASRAFFNSRPDSLSVEQAATLIGLLKAPSYYSPIRNPERSKNRRNVVLSQMLKYDYLTQTQYDDLSSKDIILDLNIQSHKSGLSPYFREYLRTTMQAIEPVRDDYRKNYDLFREDSTEWKDNPLFGWCNKNMKPDGTPYNLYKDGIKIYTTINSHMQMYAEDAVNEHIGKTLQPKFFKEQKGRKKAPFAWNVTEEQIQQILTTSMRRSERYRVLKNEGFSNSDIRQMFNKSTKMRVFTWENAEHIKDTILTPWDSIHYYKYFLNAGFMSMEPQTGYVRAYVGGIDYEHFQYDHVKLAKRQVGSTFKPFLYTLAMMNGLSPCYKVANIPVTIEMPDGQPPYTPKYSENKHEGEMVTLKYGLANSLNQISAWLIKQYTPAAVVNIARTMGVKSRIDPVASLCVGSAEVTLCEMVAAYSAFGNKGMYVEPIFVTRIEDKNGNIITNFKTHKKQAISEETAALMLYLMQGVVDMGTGIRLRYRYGFKNEIAGKTGTTNNNSDGWFIGITPQLINGAWVGGEERSIHFATTQSGEGAAVALPMWAMYMAKVYADPTLGITQDPFDHSTPISVELNCGKLEQKESEEENIKNNEDDFF